MTTKELRARLGRPPRGVTRPHDWPELTRLHARCALAVAMNTDHLKRAGGDPAAALAMMAGQLFTAALATGCLPDLTIRPPVDGFVISMKPEGMAR